MYIHKAYDFIMNEAHKIHIDRAFQRRTCWSDNTCREFIRSANLGRTPYPIVVADVHTGLEFSEEQADQFSVGRYQYVQGLRKDYVSLDGQNRVEAWRRLFNDELTLTGLFKDADGKEVSIPNKYYSSLPVRLQDALRDAAITVCVMERCLYSDLHDIFVNINSGDALNSQEKRNAINSPISEFLRKISERKNIAEMWPRISGFKDSNIKRSQDTEWTAIAYTCLLGEYEMDSKDSKLDELYSMGKGKLMKQVKQYSNYYTGRFSNIFSMVSNLVKSAKQHPSKRLAQKHFWAFVLSCEYLYDNNIEITDYEALSSLIIDLDEALSRESHLQYGKDLEKAEENNLEPPQKSSYYFFNQSNIKGIKSRKYRRSLLIDALSSSDEFSILLEESEEVA